MRGLALVTILVGCAWVSGCGKDGKFDPKVFEPPPPPPRRVEGLDAKFDTGLLSYDLQLSHEHPWDELRDVDLTIALYRQNGEKQEVRQFWANWKPKEVKKVNVPAHKYQKATVSGSAEAASLETFTEQDGKRSQGLKYSKHTVEGSWIWDWTRK